MSRKFYNGIDVVNNRIVNLASPSTSTDAVNKSYVDNLINGLTWKQSVDVTTTTNGTLATAYAAGQVIDGYTLVLGDRILLKNQTNAAENGIWIVNATGAPSRSPDGATGELTTNATVRIDNGGQADTAWTLTTTGTITVGTTNQTWVRSDSGTPYTAGNGLSLNAGTFAVVPGKGITADGTSTRVDYSVVVGKSSGLIGDGTSTSITYTHNLGTRDVIVNLYNISTFEVVETDVTNATVNTVTLTFASAPAAGAYQIVVHG
jgi:hypothetical protein